MNIINSNSIIILEKVQIYGIVKKKKSVYQAYGGFGQEGKGENVKWRIKNVRF